MTPKISKQVLGTMIFIDIMEKCYFCWRVEIPQWKYQCDNYNWNEKKRKAEALMNCSLNCVFRKFTESKTTIEQYNSLIQ